MGLWQRANCIVNKSYENSLLYSINNKFSQITDHPQKFTRVTLTVENKQNPLLKALDN